MAVRHYHHHYHFSYVTSFKRHFSSTIIVITLFITLLLIVFHFMFPQSTVNISQISFTDILEATINSLSRLLLSYVIAIFLSIPLAILITSTKRLEKILLPIFDIMQSVPVLAFFPVLVITFVKINFLEGAALFIIITAMMGNLVFSMIGGLKTIPQDISDCAEVFGATGFKKLFTITLPAIFPYIMTGSLLAWSQAWSIIIVAEALHTYIPGGTSHNDLIGLGSLLVDAFAQGKNAIFLTSLGTMIIVIALLNYFIWQKLLHFSEKFRFD